MNKGWNSRKGFRRYLRRRRFRRFAELVAAARKEKPGQTIRILDVGGRANYWMAMAGLIDFSDLDITVINLAADELLAGLPPSAKLEDYGIRAAAGDATNMPQFDDAAFDIVHSNSVIEHLFSWKNMVAAAREIARVGRRFYIQVPYFWFPYEPHFGRLFFHWLPEPTRVRMLMKRRVGWYGPYADYGEALETVRSARLPDLTQMRILFPGATIAYERVPLVKSLIAIRG